jgi:hypothetical protein
MLYAIYRNSGSVRDEVDNSLATALPEAEAIIARGLSAPYRMPRKSSGDFAGGRTEL